MKILGRKKAHELLANGTAKIVNERYCFDSGMRFNIIEWRGEQLQYLQPKKSEGV